MAAGNTNGAALAALQNRTVQIVIGVVLLVIIVAGAILFFANASKSLGVYRPIASGLDQGRALEIAAQLKTAGIDANITANETGGSTVEVREKQYDSAVLELAKSDLLITDDFKLFDKTDWAASDYEKRVKYMRAIGGEISRLVSRMEGIRWAKVHVTIPPDKVFASRYEKNKTSASVTVELEPGRILSNNQVASILSLVSGYVPELETNRISIVDTKGHIYSSATNGDENSNFMNGGNIATTIQSLNSDIERRIQVYLDGVTGIGKSQVAVSTQIITEKTTRNRTTFFPGAIGTHEYSEEALGDAASSQPYLGETFPAPLPKPVSVNNNYQSAGTEMIDSRLKKDMPPNMLSSNTASSQANVQTYNSANNMPDDSRYVCAANDEACKRNYRRHNFSIHSYPSYEQVMTESPAGTISQIKAAVVIQSGSLPVSVGDIKKGIAAAGYPGMNPDDVQIVLSNPPPAKEEPAPKNKVSLFGNKEDNKGFPWQTWLLIVGGFIVLIWLLGRLTSLFVRKPPSIKEPFSRPASAPTDGFNNPLRETYQAPPPPQPRPTQAPPPENISRPPADDDLPFDLDDEFALGDEKPAPAQPSRPQVKPSQPERRRSRVVIEDDGI